MSVSVKQIQELERVAIERIGVPSLALMENAGRSTALAVRKLLHKNRKVCIICGSGNNAGDGFVAARHLGNLGCTIQVIIIGKAENLKDDARVNYDILRRIKAPVIISKHCTSRVVTHLKNSAVVVDAIFGVGLNRDIKEPYKGFLEAINQYARKVVSVDVPSGLNADDGSVFGVCIKADVTVTFTFKKKGCTTKEGRQLCGSVAVVDIGIPKVLHKRIR